ncbi:MAG: Rpn family recombination-promoting nuclease/putative transposase, partial [Firmicutes bacterium]|nr:Rpn family recombination-promoting nuclease/putative transposase [Bacillota bacterium]
MEQHELDDLAILTSGGKIFSPKSDFVFKNIFSNEEVVTGFLKAILDIPHEEYSKIEFSNTFLNKRRRDGKYSILDLVITTKSGHKIDVEIQRAKLSDFEKRVAYYTSRLVSDQLDNNEQYDKLCRCIVIFILDHDFFTDKPERCFTKLRLRDEEGKDFTDIMEVNILELPKVKKNHAENSLYDWADFFNAKTEDDLNKIAGKSKPINRAIFG